MDSQNLHPETQKIKDKWNSYNQWEYFDENYKRIISYYLWPKLTWPNLEIGWWWYLSHLNSSVIDVSENSLAYNPAKNKTCFDLDDVWRWSRLPYYDSAFETATMVSVWQYIQYPEELLNEIKRVLMPGWKLYIINEQWAWPGKLMRQSWYSVNILKQIKDLWFDARIEDIETIWRSINWFKCVIVTMPENMLFETVEIIKRSSENILSKEEQRDLSDEKDDIFRQKYIEDELKKADYLFHMIDNYPVTSHNLKLRRKFQLISDEFKRITGKDIICTLGSEIDPEFSMALENDNLCSQFYLNTSSDKEILNDLFKKTWIKWCKLSFSPYQNYITDQLNKEDFGYHEFHNSRVFKDHMEKLISFLLSVPLNSYSKDLQEKLYENLLKKFPKNFEEKILNAQTLKFYNLFEDYKQRKKINTLIERKKLILKDNVSVEWEKKLDYLSILKRFKPIIADQLYFREREPLSYD